MGNGRIFTSGRRVYMYVLDKTFERCMCLKTFIGHL